MFSMGPRLRGDDGLDIPAIALTAFTRQDDRSKALQAGFDDYLAKPVEAGALVERIADVAARRRQEAASL
jgi:CheY-like chemotaxis protein